MKKRESNLVASSSGTKLEELNKNIKLEVDDDVDDNFNESADVNDEANSKLGNEGDASSKSDTDVNNQGKEDIGLDLSANLENQLEDNTDGLITSEVRTSYKRYVDKE